MLSGVLEILRQLGLNKKVIFRSNGKKAKEGFELENLGFSLKDSARLREIPIPSELSLQGD